MPTRLSANQALDDAATGLRCAALQPASLTGVDPSRRPPAALARPVVALALPTYRIVANPDLSHRPRPPPIASLQTQHANSSTHAAKPNANAHTPLPARARANVSSRFSIAVWTLHRTGQEPAQTRTGTPRSLSSLCTRSARLGPLVSRPLRSRQGCCAWTLAEKRRRIGPRRFLLCDAIGRVGSVV
jgi:hypothetical protein